MNDIPLASTDREELGKLLRIIEEELDYVISVIERYPHFIPEWLMWKLRDDWTEARHAFPKAKEYLFLVKDQDLINHGLTGAPLKSKIIFLHSVTNRVHWQDSRIHWPAITIRRKIVAWLLEVMDNLLDSMAIVLPPLGVVTELKKQLESALAIPDVME